MATAAPAPEIVAGETLEDLLARLGIETWNVLLVGDGSGSKWGQPAGWGCVLLEKDSMTRRVFHGAMNNATVNVAELMAYLAPLAWYTAKMEAGRERGEKLGIRDVHIITDSQYVRSVGEGGKIQKKNIVLWSAFAMYRRLGLRLHWHWLPRDDAMLNRVADEISRQARVLYTAAGVDAAVKLDINTHNPWR